MQKSQTNKLTGGYIALISAIIISVLLMTLSTTLSMTGFFARFDVLNSEYKERSIALAEACGDTAMLKLAGDINYVVTPADQNVSVDTDKCSILSISSPRTGTITIKTQGIFPALGVGGEHAYTTIQIETDPSLTIDTWKEI